MPIPPPEERPDLYDYMDCRPGPSKYPAKSAEQGKKKLHERLAADPETRHPAEKLRLPKETADG